jgi:hypothetical protein
MITLYIWLGGYSRHETVFEILTRLHSSLNSCTISANSLRRFTFCHVGSFTITLATLCLDWVWSH